MKAHIWCVWKLQVVNYLEVFLLRFEVIQHFHLYLLNTTSLDRILHGVIWEKCEFSSDIKLFVQIGKSRWISEETYKCFKSMDKFDVNFGV